MCISKEGKHLTNFDTNISGLKGFNPCKNHIQIFSYVQSFGCKFISSSNNGWGAQILPQTQGNPASTAYKWQKLVFESGYMKVSYQYAATTAAIFSAFDRNVSMLLLLWSNTTSPDQSGCHMKPTCRKIQNIYRYKYVIITLGIYSTDYISLNNTSYVYLGEFCVKKIKLFYDVHVSRYIFNENN